MNQKFSLKISSLILLIALIMPLAMSLSLTPQAFAFEADDAWGGEKDTVKSATALGESDPESIFNNLFFVLGPLFLLIAILGYLAGTKYISADKGGKDDNQAKPDK